MADGRLFCVNDGDLCTDCAGYRSTVHLKISSELYTIIFGDSSDIMPSINEEENNGKKRGGNPS